MEYTAINYDYNEDTDLYNSNIDNDISIKDYYNPPLPGEVKENEYNSQNNYYNVRDNGEWDNGKHSSLIKELEDKWELIEKKKNDSTKTRLLDINHTSDCKTINNNNMILIREWKEMIEASKQKYHTQKMSNKSIQEEDFDSFIKRKIRPLQNHSNVNAFFKIETNNIFNNNRNQLVKSFLKQENDNLNEDVYQHQIPVCNLSQPNYSFTLKKIDTSNNKKHSLNNQSVNSNPYHRDNSNSNINKKIANTYCLITEINYNNQAKQSHNTPKNGLNEFVINNKSSNIIKSNKVIKMNKTKSNYDNQMLHYVPKKKPQKFPIKLINTSNKNMIFKKVKSNYQINYKKSQPDLILNRITESTNALTDLLTVNKKNSSSANRLNNYSKDRILSSFNTKVKPVIYSKNDFNTAQKKLYKLNSNKVIQLINM